MPDRRPKTNQADQGGAGDRAPSAVGRGPAWKGDVQDWPNREHHRTVSAGGLDWSVLDMGSGPAVLLLHGTGASTHSWRDFAGCLAASFRVVAPDLPGHGFTDPARPERRGLPGTALAVSDLVQALGVDPVFAIGHSAGAAILARMTLDGLIHPRGIMSLNGAFLGFRGLAGQLFSPIAKLLVINPFVPWAFAWRAGDRKVVESLVADTGSRLDRRGIDLYARLAADPGHVAGALAMMASWDLAPLERDLHKLAVPLYLVAAANDTTVRPAQAAQVRRLAPQARVIRVKGLGHLAHEEKPAEIAALALDLARRCGALPTASLG